MQKNLFSRLYEKTKATLALVKKNHDSINEYNLSMLVSLSFVALVIFIGLTIGGFFVPLLKRLMYSYIIMAGSSLITFCIARFGLKKNSKLVSPIFYLFAANVYCFTIYLGTVKSPEQSATMFLVLLVAFSMSLLGNPFHIWSFDILMTAFFIIVDSTAKASDFFITDLVNVLSTLLISLAVSYYFVKVRIKSVALSNDLDWLSKHDALTGLQNRLCLNGYVDSLQAELLDKPASVTAIIIDIDDFKAFNDKNGHLQGDTCLSLLAKLFERFCENCGLQAYRFGGEEFVAVGVNAKADTFEQSKLFVEETSKLPLPFGEDLHFTVSLGFAEKTLTASDNVFALIEKADKALYAAKNSGKNRAQRA